MKLETPGVRVFQQRTVPAGSRLAGWALLAQTLAIPAPLRRPSCVSKQHVHGGFRGEEGLGIFYQQVRARENFFRHPIPPPPYETHRILFSYPGFLEACLRAARGL